MAWQRRMGGAPGPLGASGEAGTGQPVTVELLINGAWIDITPYVMVRDNQGQITLTKGIRDEGGQTEQASASMPLKNQDGRFTLRNPNGIWYGMIGRNQPARISVPDGLGGKSYRVHGEVPKWSPSWDPTGTDVWTDISLNGLLQRLSQGPAPEHSVIYNAVAAPLATSVVAYWPGEDPSDATTIATAMTSGSPMTISGTPALASYSGFGASDPLPDLTTSYLSGGVAAYSDPTATQVRFLCFIPKSGLSDGKVLCSIDQVDYSPGSAQFWELFYTTAGNTLWLRMCAADGTFLGIELQHTLDVRGRQMYVSVELQESGTGILRALRITDVNSGQTVSVNDVAGVTQLSRVTRVQVGPATRSVVGPTGTQFLPGVSIGHVTVQNAITPVDELGRRLNPIGESAARRIQRLCGEQGIPFEWVGDLDDTTPMGPQGKANPLSLMRDAVLADGGLLYESTSVLGLGYRTRASLYNQDPALVLNYTGYNLSQVPTPVEDDQRIQNQITVSVNGVTATYEETSGTLSTAPPPAGVGVYGPNSDSPLALNLSTTDQPTLLDQAAWRVHLGTVDEARYPQISVNLAHPSITPEMRRAVLAVRIGDRMQVINPPPFLGTDAIDQLVLGAEEQITHFEHRLTFTCAPASPYNQIGNLDSDDVRIDIDTELYAAATSAATALTVGPSAGELSLWTTNPADMPFDVRAGGEVMTVTAVDGWMRDTFTRSTSGDWGTSDTGQVWGAIGGTPATDFSTNGSAAVHTLTTVSASRRSFTDFTWRDFDVYTSITTSATATGDSLYGGPVGRYQDADNLYMLRAEFTTGNTVNLEIRKRVATIETSLATYSTSLTHVPGTLLRMRFKIVGGLLMGKIWLPSDGEFPGWQVWVTDTSVAGSNFIGCRSIAGPGNTNVNPQVRYDDLTVANPQTLSVTRSVNGVTKAQPSGTPLSLAHPTHLAL